MIIDREIKCTNCIKLRYSNYFYTFLESKSLIYKVIINNSFILTFRGTLSNSFCLKNKLIKTLYN